MDRKRRRITEGVLYLFSQPRGVNKARMVEVVEAALEATNCGRVLGSGTSLANDGTVAIEIGAYDCEAANDAISRVCRRLRCREFELVLD